MTRRLTASYFAASVICLLTTGVAQAAPFSATLNSQDAIRGEAEAFSIGYRVDDSNSGLVGVSGALGERGNFNTVVGFILPTLDAAIDSVTFTIDQTDFRDNGFLEIDFYGLNTTNPDGSGTSLYFEGETDASHVEIVDAIANNNDTNPDNLNLPRTIMVDNAALIGFVSGLYSGVNPTQTEVFFRFNLDTDINFPSPLRRINLDSSSATLTINTVPEPASLALVGLGGLMMLSRRR